MTAAPASSDSFIFQTSRLEFIFVSRFEPRCPAAGTNQFEVEATAERGKRSQPISHDCVSAQTAVAFGSRGDARNVHRRRRKRVERRALFVLRDVVLCAPDYLAPHVVLVLSVVVPLDVVPQLGAAAPGPSSGGFVGPMRLGVVALRLVRLGIRHAGHSGSRVCRNRSRPSRYDVGLFPHGWAAPATPGGA